jgi:hypothetical protein
MEQNAQAVGQVARHKDMGLGLTSEEITLQVAYYDCQDVMVRVKGFDCSVEREGSRFAVSHISRKTSEMWGTP